MTKTKADELEIQLAEAKRIGAVDDFEKKSTGNRELQWHIDLPAGGGALALKTKEAGLFVLGIDIGRQIAAPRRGSNAIRDAITADGRVIVELTDPANADVVRRQRNGLFSNAYALGYKGRFTVRREGDQLIGEVAS